MSFVTCVGEKVLCLAVIAPGWIPALIGCSMLSDPTYRLD